MAANSTNRKRPCVDYFSLHHLSSVCLYDTAKKARNKFYAVERIIEKRKMGHNEEYLLKWLGWPMHACTWEPAEHLTTDLLRLYERPLMPDQYRMEIAGRNLHQAILTNLKGNSVAPVDVRMDLDVQRFLFKGKGVASEHKGYKMYNKIDFSRLFTYLPESWWYRLDANGQGTAIDFPLKMKPVLSWTPGHYVKQNGKLLKGPRAPVEKLKIHFVKKACSLESV